MYWRTTIMWIDDTNLQHQSNTQIATSDMGLIGSMQHRRMCEEIATEHFRIARQYYPHNRFRPTTVQTFLVTSAGIDGRATDWEMLARLNAKLRNFCHGS